MAMSRGVSDQDGNVCILRDEDDNNTPYDYLDDQLTTKDVIDLASKNNWDNVTGRVELNLLFGTLVNMVALGSSILGLFAACRKLDCIMTCGFCFFVIIVIPASAVQLIMAHSEGKSSNV